MQVFNSLGRALQDLETRDAGQVGIYLCGPTVQAAPPIGHGRGQVVFDVLRRYLQWKGLEVTFVSNVTDVNDSIIEQAEARGIDWTEVVAESTEQFITGYQRLGVADPDVRPTVTGHMSEIIELIERLVENGSAYEAEGDVYFRVRSFPDYGKLSGRKIDDLISGARIEPGEHKEDTLDFALWKAAKPGEPSWSSPWGVGRPGWHIECSAMATKYLGEGFDIHGGGVDLIFPHHENEVAQSEAASDSDFCRYWMHNGMINLTGEKMSKSVGNVVGLHEVMDRYHPLVVRFFYLRSHYRKPVDFSDEIMDDASAALDRLWSFGRRASGDAEPDADALAAFRAAMEDDLDTAGALAAVFEVVRSGNAALDAGESAAAQLAAYQEMMAVLGLLEPAQDASDLDLSALAEEVGAEASIDSILERRLRARSEKDFAVSDRIRDALGELGITLEDTADGTRWHRK